MTPSARTLGPVVVVLGALAVAGCSMHPAPAEDEARPPALLTVTNESLNPVRVYGLKEGGRKKEFGAVEPQQSRQFPVPRALLTPGTIQLLAVPTARKENYRSPPVLLAEGQHLQWELQSVPGTAFLQRSSMR